MFSLVRGLPSAASASRVSAILVRLLRWYYASVRLLARVHARIELLASRADPAAGWPRMPARSLGSRACSFSTCSWLLDYAGPDGSSRYRSHQCCLPVASTRSAPELRFSKLNSRPVDASVYASPGASRHPAQDSRSRWFAIPFLWAPSSPTTRRFIPTIALPHGHGFHEKAVSSQGNNLSLGESSSKCASLDPRSAPLREPPFPLIRQGFLRKGGWLSRAARFWPA
jgi:hypothetical protein